MRSAGRAPDSVVSDFDTSARQHVLEESPEEFMAGKRDVAGLAGAVIAVVETDLAVVDGLQTAVGDGDAEYVAAEIVEDLFTAARMLTVNDPGFFPKGWRHVADQA